MWRRVAASSPLLLLQLLASNLHLSLLERGLLEVWLQETEVKIALVLFLGIKAA